MKSHNPRIVLSNTYGHPNVGDEAILTSMISVISESIRNVQITVLSRRPRVTEKNHPYVQVIHSGVIKGVLKTLRAIKDADLLIIGGGGIIQDSTSLGNLLFHLSRPLIAWLCRTPFVCYSLGVGPLRTKVARFLVSLILRKAIHITVRDQSSGDLLSQIGIPPRRVRCTADPAFLLKYPKDPLENIMYRKIYRLKQQGKPVVGISLRPFTSTYNLLGHGSYEKNYGKLPDIMVDVSKFLIDEIDANFVFFSMHPEQDDVLGELFLKNIDDPDRSVFVPGSLSPAEMLSAIGLSDLFIGMRLHALIFASMSLVPLIALSYQPKVEGVMKLLGQEDYIVQPPKWNVENLVTMVRKAWDKRISIKSEIGLRIPSLQDNAWEDVESIVSILKNSHRLKK